MESIERTIDMENSYVSVNYILTGSVLITLQPIPTYMDVLSTKQPEETKLSSLKIRHTN